MTYQPSLRCRTTVATFVLLTIAGCAGRSLNQPPQIVDWSNGAQPTVSRASPSPADQAVLYTVRRDDTLESIAARFNTTPTNLAAWNNLAPNARVRPDQVLRIAPPGASAPVDSSPVATTQAIGSGTVEQRALGPPVSSTPIAPSVAPAPSNAPLKTGPLGVRRPYTDATLAELSRADGEGPSVVVATSPPPVAPPTAAGPAWAWPAAARSVTGFDERTKGIDIAGKAGDAVLAAADGKVTFSGTGVRGYGILVIIQHSPDLLSVYAHNRANLVQDGATVTKGQKIAEMGNSESDSVRLHFEIRRDSKPVDPLQYLPPR